MSESDKELLEFKKENEGEFWMCFDDFYFYFDSIQFCHLTPEAFSDEILQRKTNSTISWNMIAYDGEWVKNKSAGGSGNGNDKRYWSNPQYLVKLNDIDLNDDENLSTIIISLMQKYTREKRMLNNGQPAEEFMQFRFYRIIKDSDAEKSIKTGFKLNEEQLERVGNSGDYINKREITTRFRVKPGYYVIIPSLFDYNIAGEFLLRLFTEQFISYNSSHILVKDTEMRKIGIMGDVNVESTLKSFVTVIGHVANQGKAKAENEKTNYNCNILGGHSSLFNNALDNIHVQMYDKEKSSKKDLKQSCSLM